MSMDQLQQLFLMEDNLRLGNNVSLQTGWENIWAASWQNQQNHYVPGEDSDQPEHLPSLISLHCALNG